MAPISPYFKAQTADAALSTAQNQVLDIANNQAIATEQFGFEIVKEAADKLLNNLTDAMYWKEFFLDALVWFLKDVLIRQMLNDLLTWINNGFQGSPMFMQNFGGFMGDVADQAAGEFIRGMGLGFVCSPFQLDVQIALDLLYRQGRNQGTQCTLTGIVDNIDGFLSGGDFTQGGWKGWFELTMKPSNDPMGAYLEGEALARIAVRNAAGEQITLLNWGNGFLSSVLCKNPGADGSDGVTQKGSASSQNDCWIETPGKVIEGATTFNIGASGPLVLIEADEFNEIVSAALVQLAKMALGGIMGSDGRSGLASYDQSALLNNGITPPVPPSSLEDSVDDADLLIEKYEALIADVERAIASYDRFIAELQAVFDAENTGANTEWDLQFSSSIPGCSELFALQTSGPSVSTDSNSIDLVYNTFAEEDAARNTLTGVVSRLESDVNTSNSTRSRSQQVVDEAAQISNDPVSGLSTDQINDAWSITDIGRDYLDPYNSNDPLSQPISEEILVAFDAKTYPKVQGLIWEFTTTVQEYGRECIANIKNRCENNDGNSNDEVERYINDPDNNDADDNPASRSEARQAVWEADGCYAITNNEITVPSVQGIEFAPSPPTP